MAQCIKIGRFELAGLRKNNSAKPAAKPERTSPRKKQKPESKGSITTSDGRRKSARTRGKSPGVEG